MKGIGSILLFAGFLAGAFFMVQHTESIDWMYYGPCAAVMLVGVFLMRSADRQEQGDPESSRADLDVLRRSIANITDKLRLWNDDAKPEEVYGLSGAIDRDLLADLDAFANARESMIPTFGLQTYADVMSAFATGERLLNRCWSASADGYADEAYASLKGAESEMKKAQELLQEAMA